MKSTLEKLWGVGIVYLIFLFTEMKCHGEMFSYVNNHTNISVGNDRSPTRQTRVEISGGE
jgi:Ca2+/H+ antiporter